MAGRDLLRAARLGGSVALVCLVWLALPAHADAQLGALISPGRLARPHQALEGIANCQKCHEQGRKTTAEKCFTCHTAVAERMAARRGVHRNVTAPCASCHAEHGGTNGVLRPFDTRGFDHAAVTGFALTGRHAAVADRCDACHKTRSFLTVAATCTACHTDVHKGTLATTCTRCHSTQAAFADAVRTFDHSKAAFRLSGAHETVPCASCHVNRVFKGMKFTSCTSCHRDPHRQLFTASCTTCHSNTTWRTRRIDHSQTRFPLLGRHVSVDCAKCHERPPMQATLVARSCAACHDDIHRGTFKQDCRACHSESGFERAPFDHSQTRFALTGKHGGLQCQACHTAVTRDRTERPQADFRGLNTACANCHTDVHRQALGAACDACHTPATFRVTVYTHRGPSEFFTGAHASVVCERCHARGAAVRPVATREALESLESLESLTDLTFRNASRTCAACHKDVHLGQVGTDCGACHSVRAANFALTDAFSHANTAFPLTGRHQTVDCARCHARETATFPSGAGAAVRLKGVARECGSCHRDVHLGQFAAACDSCHATTSFTLTTYTHRSQAVSGFFVGRHVGRKCDACHKTTTRRFPAGVGTAVRFKVGSDCTTCHVDVHRGSLGSRCGDCHHP